MRGIFGGAANNHRYGLTFSIQARNLFNRENLATPVGVLSPNFGQTLSLAGGGFGPGGGGGATQAANRRVDLQVQFSF
jgi:hypothetical protein